jgi:hypothetical protein
LDLIQSLETSLSEIAIEYALKLCKKNNQAFEENYFLLHYHFYFFRLRLKVYKALLCNDKRSNNE